MHIRVYKKPISKVDSERTCPTWIPTLGNQEVTLFHQWVLFPLKYCWEKAWQIESFIYCSTPLNKCAERLSSSSWSVPFQIAFKANSRYDSMVHVCKSTKYGNGSTYLQLLNPVAPIFFALWRLIWETTTGSKTE